MHLTLTLSPILTLPRWGAPAARVPRWRPFGAFTRDEAGATRPGANQTSGLAYTAGRPSSHR